LAILNKLGRLPLHADNPVNTMLLWCSMESISKLAWLEMLKVIVVNRKSENWKGKSRNNLKVEVVWQTLTIRERWHGFTEIRTGVRREIEVKSFYRFLGSKRVKERYLFAQALSWPSSRLGGHYSSTRQGLAPPLWLRFHPDGATPLLGLQTVPRVPARVDKQLPWWCPLELEIGNSLLQDCLVIDYENISQRCFFCLSDLKS